MIQEVICKNCRSAEIREVVVKADYFKVFLEEGRLETVWVDSGDAEEVYMYCSACNTTYPLEAEEYIEANPGCVVDEPTLP